MTVFKKDHMSHQIRFLSTYEPSYPILILSSLVLRKPPIANGYTTFKMNVQNMMSDLMMNVIFISLVALPTRN